MTKVSGENRFSRLGFWSFFETCCVFFRFPSPFRIKYCSCKFFVFSFSPLLATVRVKAAIAWQAEVLVEVVEEREKERGEYEEQDGESLEWGEDLSDRLTPPPSPLGHLVSTAFLLVPLSICRVASGLCLRESDQFMLSIILGRKLFYSMLMKAAQCMFGLYQLESGLEARRLFPYFEKKFACLRWRDWGFLTILRFGYAAVGIPQRQLSDRTCGGLSLSCR